MVKVEEILKNIVKFQLNHPSLIITIALMLSFSSFYFAFKKMDFYTAQKDLISPKHKLIRLYEERFDQFDDMDNFIVVIHHKDKEEALRFLKKLASILEKQKDKYLEVFYRIDPERFKSWQLLYLEKDELLDIRSKLEDYHELIKDLIRSPSLEHILEAINREMTSKMIGELFTGFLEESEEEEKKPFDLSFLISLLKEMLLWIEGKKYYSSPWKSLFSGGIQEDEEYFWTKNKKYLLMFVTPKKAEEGFTKAKESLYALRNTISELKKSFPGIEVGVTGPEALNTDEMSIALRDMTIATVISFLGLIVLLCLFWGGIRRPILEMIELSVALAITTGFTTLVIGHLNILSVTFAPLLLGLGIDYGIHWLARYQEEIRFGGLDKGEAIERTMLKLGPGILLAGLTASLSFMPLILTGFLGLVELGIITSAGMVLTTITTLCLLPSLVIKFDKQDYSSFSIPIEIRPSLKITQRKAILITASGIMLTAFCLFGAKNIKFDLNMLNLQSKHAEAVIWEKKLLYDSGRSSMYGAVFAKSFCEIDKKERKLERLPTVSDVKSIKDVLPEDQEEKLRILRSMKPLVSDIKFGFPDRDEIDIYKIDEILKRIRFKMLPSSAKKWGVNKPTEEQMRQVRELISKIRSRLFSTEESVLIQRLKTFEKKLVCDLKDKIETIIENVNTRKMTINDIPEEIRKRFITCDNLFLIRVFPSGDIWDPSFLGRFVDDIRKVDPEATGDPVILYVFTKAFRNACIKAAIYAILFIFLLLLITLRNLVHSVLIMIPLIAGTIWTMGLMEVFDIDFNLANSLFLPLIVGAGVEYGIIIIRRWKEIKVKDKLILPFSTIKGVLLAGLTTTVGFGSLIISDHQGIYSLGLLAVIGSLSILTAAIFFLPSILCLISRG